MFTNRENIETRWRRQASIAAPSVVLAAIAAVTERIRLASAVTILSTVDPVLVFEDFATVDLISGGRAENIVGRGIFTESFRCSVMTLPTTTICTRKNSSC